MNKAKKTLLLEPQVVHIEHSTIAGLLTPFELSSSC